MKKETGFGLIYGMGMKEAKDKSEKERSETVVADELSLEDTTKGVESRSRRVGYHAEWFWHVK